MPELLIEGGRFSGLPFFVNAGRGRGHGWVMSGGVAALRLEPTGARNRNTGGPAFKPTTPRLLDENGGISSSPSAGQSFECVPSQSAPLELCLQPQK